MPDTAYDKLEAYAKTLLEAEAGLTGFEIFTDYTSAVSSSADKKIYLHVTSIDFDANYCQGQASHRVPLEIIAMTGPQPEGTINKANREALAYVHRALVADRYWGGRIQLIEEDNLVGVISDEKDNHGAQLNYEMLFYTPRDDWFTIVGVHGVNY